MVRLRPYKRTDASTIVSWVADARIFHQWSADRLGTYPISAERLDDYYEGYRDADWFYPMSAFDDEGLCGHLIMRFTDDEKQVLRLGFIIVDDARRNQGLGREIVGLALTMAFRVLGAEVVTLVAFENNPAAYHLYASCGFIDTTADEPERYDVLGETWSCRTLSMDRARYEAL